MITRLRRLITFWFFTFVVLAGAGVLTLPPGSTGEHIGGMLTRAITWAVVVAAPTLFIHQKAKV